MHLASARHACARAPCHTVALPVVNAAAVLVCHLRTCTPCSCARSPPAHSCCPGAPCTPDTRRPLKGTRCRSGVRSASGHPDLHPGYSLPAEPLLKAIQVRISIHHSAFISDQLQVALTFNYVSATHATLLYAQATLLQRTGLAVRPSNQESHLLEARYATWSFTTVYDAKPCLDLIPNVPHWFDNSQTWSFLLAAPDPVHPKALPKGHCMTGCTSYWARLLSELTQNGINSFSVCEYPAYIHPRFLVKLHMMQMLAADDDAKETSGFVPKIVMGFAEYFRMAVPSHARYADHFEHGSRLTDDPDSEGN